MSSVKFKNVVVALVLGAAQALSFAVPGVGSIAGTGGASEVTQLMNNVQLAAGVREQVSTVSQLVQTYQTTYSQLQQQLLAGMNVQGFNLADVTKTKSALDSYQNSLRSVNYDASTLGNVFDTRLTEARLQNITLEDYVKREGARIEAGNTAAKTRLQREVQLLGQIQEDAALIREYGNQIPDTVGVHEATRLLNAQVNLLLQQTSRLTAIMLDSLNGGNKQSLVDQNKAQADNILADSITSKLDTQQKAQKDAERAAISRMRP